MQRFRRRTYTVLTIAALLSLIPIIGAAAPGGLPTTMDILNAIRDVERKLWSNDDSLKNETQALAIKVNDTFAAVQDVSADLDAKKSFYKLGNGTLFFNVNSTRTGHFDIELASCGTVPSSACAFTVEEILLVRVSGFALGVSCNITQIKVDGADLGIAAVGLPAGDERQLLVESHLVQLAAFVAVRISFNCINPAASPSANFFIDIHAVGEKPQGATVQLSVTLGPF